MRPAIILLKCDSNRPFFSPCDLQIWWMASKNNRAPLLHYIKLCASFQIHQWIQTGLTVWKHSVWVKMDDFLSHETFKYYGWSWKILRHLFHATSSFVHHFIAIGEFKLELQSGKAQFGSKLKIDNFFSRVTSQFDRWPWKTIGHLFYATSTFVHHSVAIGEFKLELQPEKVQFGSKSTIFFSCVTLKFDGWPSKTIGHLFYATSSVVHHFVAN